MTKDEALKMAIEAMKITDEAFTEFSKGLVGLGIPASILRLDKQSRLIPAIQACKEALAQPKEWVGLSDLEIAKIIGAEWWKEKHKFAKAIEAKLKELNYAI